MDEPFVSLDAAGALRLRRLLLNLLERHSAAMLLVTHDLREAIMLCDRLVFLSPPPARILHEVRITLSPEERMSEEAIETLRTQIVQEVKLDPASLELDL